MQSFFRPVLLVSLLSALAFACTVEVNPCPKKATSQECQTCCIIDNKARGFSFTNFPSPDCKCHLPSVCDSETASKDACEICCKTKLRKDSYALTPSLCQCL